MERGRKPNQAPAEKQRPIRSTLKEVGAFGIALAKVYALPFATVALGFAAWKLSGVLPQTTTIDTGVRYSYPEMNQYNPDLHQGTGQAMFPIFFDWGGKVVMLAGAARALGKTWRMFA